MKRKELILLASLMSAFAIASCGTPSTSSDAAQTSEEETPVYDFETIFTDNHEKTLEVYDPSEPTKNGVISYDILQNVGEKNYMKISLSTNVNLVGHITYTKEDDSSTSNDEKFFIEANQEEFVTFLDAYRLGAFGAYRKTIRKITLQNVDSTKKGNVTLKSVAFSSRKYSPDEELFLDDGTTKVGTSLGLGGAITYVARLGVKEYIDENENTQFGRNYDSTKNDLISEEGNLVNEYDLGREIQQSFYWPVKSVNGYNPTSEQKYPGDLNYNPIQCGSAGSVGPQIVDYHANSKEIYVKAYGQDWYLVNQVDATYFETTITFGEAGVVKVNNKITNFCQFINTSGLEFVKQESPAFYSSYPLNYFYAETDEGTIFDENLSPMTGSHPTKTSLNDAVSSDTYNYKISESRIKDKWIAFVNEKKFGLGIYNPTADYFNASRGWSSIRYYDGPNSTPHNDFYKGDINDFVPSSFANNYDYASTAINCQMIDFVPLDFDYALFAGDVVEMKAAFKKLNTSGEMTRKNIAWPTREEA